MKPLHRPEGSSTLDVHRGDGQAASDMCLRSWIDSSLMLAIRSCGPQNASNIWSASIAVASAMMFA